MLAAEGVIPVNSGIVWQARHRWYEMPGPRCLANSDASDRTKGRMGELYGA